MKASSPTAEMAPSRTRLEVLKTTVHGQEALSPRRLCIPDRTTWVFVILTRTSPVFALGTKNCVVLAVVAPTRSGVTGRQREETPSFTQTRRASYVCYAIALVTRTAATTAKASIRQCNKPSRRFILAPSLYVSRVLSAAAHKPHISPLTQCSDMLDFV